MGWPFWLSTEVVDPSRGWVLVRNLCRLLFALQDDAQPVGLRIFRGSVRGLILIQWQNRDVFSGRTARSIIHSDFV